MNKTLKKIISAMLVVLMCITAAPLGGFVGLDLGLTASALPGTGAGMTKAETIGTGISYTIADGVLTISGTGKTDDFDPDEDHIASPFYEDESITSIVVEEGITYLGKNIFNLCRKVTSVTLPSTLEEIGDYAFKWCHELEEVVIPDKVTTIGNYAFYHCRELKTVTCGKSLEIIGAYAFDTCDALEEITFGDSLKTIYGYAFDTCSKLKSVTIPYSITEIGEKAFYNCIGLTDVYYFGTETQWGKVTKGDGYLDQTNRDNTDYSTYHGATVTYLLNEENKLGDNVYFIINADNSVNIVGSGSMYNYGLGSNLSPLANNTDITSVTISDGITTIGENLMRNCKNLKSLTIPGSVETIRAKAFFNCSALDELTLTEGVKAIEYDAFNSTNLKSVKLPASLTEIGDTTFFNCYSLSEITVADGSNSFSAENGVLFNKDKTKLIFYPIAKAGTEYDVPDTVISIEDCAFAATRLEKVTLPEGLTTIPLQAFVDSSIKEITIPDSVTTIEFMAFGGCISLQDVYYGGTKDSWDNITVEESNDSLADANIHYADPIAKIGLIVNRADATLDGDKIVLTSHPNANNIAIKPQTSNGDSVVINRDNTKIKISSDGRYVLYYTDWKADGEQAETTVTIGEKTYRLSFEFTTEVLAAKHVVSSGYKVELDNENKTIVIYARKNAEFITMSNRSNCLKAFEFKIEAGDGVEYDSDKCVYTLAVEKDGVVEKKVTVNDRRYCEDEYTLKIVSVDFNPVAELKLIRSKAKFDAVNQTVTFDMVKRLNESENAIGIYNLTRSGYTVEVTDADGITSENRSDAFVAYDVKNNGQQTATLKITLDDSTVKEYKVIFNFTEKAAPEYDLISELKLIRANAEYDEGSRTVSFEMVERLNKSENAIGIYSKTKSGYKCEIVGADGITFAERSDGAFVAYDTKNNGQQTATLKITLADGTVEEYTAIFNFSE